MMKRESESGLEAKDDQPNQTPLADLRRYALAHYEEISLQAHNWLSTIPRAINFYFDAEEAKISSSKAARPLLGSLKDQLGTDEEFLHGTAEAAPPRATTPMSMTGPFMEKRRAELWQTMPAASPSMPRDVLERSIEAQVHFELGVRIGERRAPLEREAARMRREAIEGFAAHLYTFGTVIQREKVLNIAQAYLADLCL